MDAANPIRDLPYDQDGLRSIHNHEFMSEPRFLRAYARGVRAAGKDYNWHWRVHVGLWAARTASALEGDFVECGVNRGFLSSAIMEDLDWNSRDRRFWLLDTFAGLDFRYVSAAELADGIEGRNQREVESGFYTFDVDEVRRNFAEWPRAIVVVGAIPETLDQVTSDQIAFLHLDLNCSPPEVAALERFWDRLAPGGIVLMDDYAYAGYRQQKLGMDAFARAHGVEVLSLPTGQGLLVKPRHVEGGGLCCGICGGRVFEDRRILWDQLIAEWQLAPDEVRYVDRQQGTTCVACGSNLRTIALAQAIVAWTDAAQPLFRDWLETPLARACRVLEVNEAGMLSPLLRTLPGHVLATYPEVDVTALPYADGSFDLVVHSDTLEHVADPVRALAECRRVLRPGGALCFTIPTIIGRMSRSREGLPSSFHGNPETSSEDYSVKTEFGADAWTYVVRAGFQAVTIHTVDFPSATAMLARKGA